KRRRDIPLFTGRTEAPAFLYKCLQTDLVDMTEDTARLRRIAHAKDRPNVTIYRTLHHALVKATETVKCHDMQQPPSDMAARGRFPPRRYLIVSPDRLRAAPHIVRITPFYLVPHFTACL